MLEKTNKGEGCFEWRSLRSTGMNRSDTIRAHGNALQACMTGLIPAQPSFLLAPVFPGCHVICRPATCHGIEPPPFLPSLDRRAGIEPALSLLVAGGDPGLTAMPTLLKALRGISLLSLLAKGASPLRTTPTLKPCVTRTGFRHLRARRRLTIPLRTVKSLPRFPAATGTPEARYCAQGFNVGPNP